MHTYYTCVSKGRLGKPRRASPHGARARRLTSPGPAPCLPRRSGAGNSAALLRRQLAAEPPGPAPRLGQPLLRPLGLPGRPGQRAHPQRLTLRRGLGQHGPLSFPRHFVTRIHLFHHRS